MTTYEQIDLDCPFFQQILANAPNAAADNTMQVILDKFDGMTLPEAVTLLCHSHDATIRNMRAGGFSIDSAVSCARLIFAREMHVLTTAAAVQMGETLKAEEAARN